ncbi:hypothetical protein BHE90_007218 [Fusarium euwallaceae]|uniref:DUF7136 domain-containing protein n=3 Tax=Fusarium solani species complex TaxID=232080 RepID=A0A3M2SKR3_9HYPO|nr:hypothetical protein CDV36_002134 [Fusarium kuroshium]RSM02285.1 hypothetical protein CDV31_011006 [Fusarium ambrosium]RTE78289.1 hypothetical protein BHE90_007218 [Fusarium euwallaceae]
MRGVLSLIALSGVAVAKDQVSFPATGEFDVVFPRNETYAVEAPFPVIFGFQNAPVLLSFPTQINWELTCGLGTLFGINRFEGERSIAPPSDPYFYINSSRALMKAEEGDQFKYFRNDHDTCILTWELFYYTTCERESDGSLKIMGGYFPKRTGNVTFTLRPGAKTPREAIANYNGCAVAGTAVKVQSNETGCAQIAQDAAPKPKPCELDVKGVASSLAAAVVKPTTSLTALPSTTTEAGSSRTGLGSASETTTTGGGSGGSGSGDGGSSSSSDDDGNWATGGFTISGGKLTLIFAVVAAAVVPIVL